MQKEKNIGSELLDVLLHFFHKPWNKLTPMGSGHYGYFLCVLFYVHKNVTAKDIWRMLHC